MTTLKTNLKSQVRQTPLPKWKPLIPLFEAVMNSIQSIRERNPKGGGMVRIEIHRDRDLLGDDNPPIDGFTITDDGVGLHDDNFDSFNTAFSDYKERTGGKGLGRFTWLKAFERAEIDSIFIPKGETALRRKFTFDEAYDPDNGVPVDAPDGVPGMKIRLAGLKEPYKIQFPRTAEHLVQRLVEHFLLIFLEPGCPKIDVIDQGHTYSANDVFEADFKKAASVHKFAIKGHEFTLHGFRLTTPRVSNHKLVYAANQRGVVSDDLRDHILNLSTRLPDKDGETFVYLAIVQSPYLTQHVNPARTDFDFNSGEDAEVEPSMFADEIKRSEIRDEAVKFIQSDLSSVIETINAAKEEKIRSYVHTEAPQYRVLMKYSDQFINKIAPAAFHCSLREALGEIRSMQRLVNQ